MLAFKQEKKDFLIPLLFKIPPQTREQIVMQNPQKQKTPLTSGHDI